MRGQTFSVSNEFVVEECCNCGIAFGFPTAFKQECREKPGPNGKSFYCPNGHRQWYLGETEADKLRRERDRLAQKVAEKDDDIRQARADRDKAEREATKLKKRVGNGVCPCCTRSFVNLQRHIATKHPDYGDPKVVQLKAS